MPAAICSSRNLMPSTIQCKIKSFSAAGLLSYSAAGLMSFQEFDAFGNSVYEQVFERSGLLSFEAQRANN
jgi:hypothetical protein